jgi:hypothetical protein
MAKNKSPTSIPASGETPSPSAKLTIKVGPAQIAKGSVPPDQARHLITAFGILGSIFTGISGAVLTLRIAPDLINVAYVELIITLTAAVLIAVCGRGVH